VLDMFNHWVATLAHQRGIDPHIARSLGTLLHNVGLRGVVARSVELPIGRQGGRFGELMAEDFLARVEQLGAMILASNLATPHEYDGFLSALTAEMDQYTYVQPFCIAYGRR